MALIFHERVGLEGRRISPFSWRIRYALAHKGLQPTVLPTRFADVARIRALSGQDLVPIIEHDETVVHDSWSIACHLEDRFPDASVAVRRRHRARHRAAGEHLVRHRAGSCHAAAGLRRLHSLHRSGRPRLFPWLARDPTGHDTRAIQCRSRRGVGRPGRRPARHLERTLSEQAFLAGEAPAYVDYIIFSVFQWARIGSPRDVLADTAEMDGNACVAGAHGGAVR